MSKPVSIEQATGATVHYHTGVFNKKNTTVMALTGLVGITALAIGVIALLHANGVIHAGLLGSIPPAGAYALIGIGGTLVLADLIALVIYARRHSAIKKPMQEYMKDQTEHNLGWWKDRFHKRYGEVRPRKSWQKRFTSFENSESIPGTTINGALKVSGLQKSIHLFLDEKRMDAFIKDLEGNQKFSYVMWNDSSSSSDSSD